MNPEPNETPQETIARLVNERAKERKAFEAMQDALLEVSLWYESEYPFDETGNTYDRVSFQRIERWRAALSLSQEVSK